MLAPINSNKHYVHQAIIAVASSAIANIVISDSVVAPAAAASNSVEEGSVIKNVWVEMWLIGTGATDNQSSFTMALEKTVANQTAMTFAESVALGAYPNKKNILYVTQGLLGSNVDGQGAVPMMRGWFKIPRGKQRQGFEDKIVLNIAATGNPINACGIFTYKEYR